MAKYWFLYPISLENQSPTRKKFHESQFHYNERVNGEIDSWLKQSTIIREFYEFSLEDPINEEDSHIDRGSFNWLCLNTVDIRVEIYDQRISVYIKKKVTAKNDELFYLFIDPISNLMFDESDTSNFPLLW